jgi:hypothetical protein
MILQMHYLGGQCVNHLLMIFNGLLVDDQFFLLTLNNTNQIIHHIGQLFDLHVLLSDTAVKLIHNPTHLVRIVAHKFDMLRQHVQGMVLLEGNPFNSSVELVDLCQQIDPDDGGVLGRPLKPIVLTLLLGFKQTSLQKATKGPKKVSS